MPEIKCYIGPSDIVPGPLYSVSVQCYAALPPRSSPSTMSSSKVVVVFGATGNQGGSVIQTFLNDPKLTQQFKLRAITRDPSKPAAKALAAKGVDCVTV